MPEDKPPPEEDRVLKFANNWRSRLLARHPGHVERLSDEGFGQLVTLNTIICFIQHP